MFKRPVIRIPASHSVRVLPSGDRVSVTVAKGVKVVKPITNQRDNIYSVVSVCSLNPFEKVESVLKDFSSLYQAKHYADDVARNSKTSDVIRVLNKNTELYCVVGLR